jgi:hypothetical protein
MSTSLINQMISDALKWRQTPKGNHRSEIGKFKIAVFRHHTGTWGYKIDSENNFYSQVFDSHDEAKQAVIDALVSVSTSRGVAR